jgi:hypothetical protein
MALQWCVLRAGGGASDLDAASARAGLGLRVKESSPGSCPAPALSVADARLPPEVQRCMGALGYAQPTPVQAQCWTAALAGLDLLAVAETGTGKTLGYLLPAAAHLAARRAPAAPAAPAAPRQQPPSQLPHPPSPQVLVLVPTRELAQQVLAACRGPVVRLGGVRAAVVHGGVDHAREHAAALAAPGFNLLVATPGRLHDLVLTRQPPAVRLADVSLLVLDEADRMLDMGLQEVLEALRAAARPDRQTLLFSATFTERARAQALLGWLRLPRVRIVVGGGAGRRGLAGPAGPLPAAGAGAGGGAWAAADSGGADSSSSSAGALAGAGMESVEGTVQVEEEEEAGGAEEAGEAEEGGGAEEGSDENDAVGRHQPRSADGAAPADVNVAAHITQVKRGCTAHLQIRILALLAPCPAPPCLAARTLTACPCLPAQRRRCTCARSTRSPRSC